MFSRSSTRARLKFQGRDGLFSGQVFERRAWIPAFAALLLVLCAGEAGSADPQRRPISPREADDAELKVGSISFNHTPKKRIRNTDLRAAMQTRIGEKFQRRFFLNDLTQIENLHRSGGYMGMEFVGKILEVDEDGKLHIRLKIDSKRQWRVARVNLTLAADRDTSALWKEVGVRAGDRFVYGDVVRAELELQTYLNQRGYPHAQVRHELILDPVEEAAAVEYIVDPGKKMYVGAIRIAAAGANQADESDGLHTRPALVMRYLTFSEGDLYNPEQLRISRTNLARTNLFRSVTFNTAVEAATDSLQPVDVRLTERKFVHLGANFLLNNKEPRVTGNLQHSNWLGRGGRIGMDASLGQPVQGATVYLTERHVLGTGADLTVSAGVTEEWGNTVAPANLGDSLQVALLTQNDSSLRDGFGLFGDLYAVPYILSSSYDYRSIERLWSVNSTLTRFWGRGTPTTYALDFSVAWTRSATRAIGGSITYRPGEGPDEGAFDSDDDFGDDPLGDDADFKSVVRPVQDPEPVDYSEGRIPLDEVWKEILLQRSRALNFQVGLERDTRDSQISTRRGTFVRASGLYALQLGGQETRVLGGNMEGRFYLPLGRNVVWAEAVRVEQIASLRADRALPRAYWKEFGGDGSVRGVERNTIQDVGGGRRGFNLRSELRLYHREFGLVLFWDRADVWRHSEDVRWEGMVDGYGVGFRYTVGIPFRADFAFDDGFEEGKGYIFYFSIGQAF